jgi:hypothetical protein
MQLLRSWPLGFATFLILALLFAFAACDSGEPDLKAGDARLFIGTESNSIESVSTTRPFPTRSFGPVPRLKDNLSISRDGSLLHAIFLTEHGTREMVTLDASSGSEIWRIVVPDFDGFYVDAMAALLPAPREGYFLVNLLSRDGKHGRLVLWNPLTHDVTAEVEFSAMRFTAAYLAGDELHTSGRFVIAGSSTPYGERFSAPQVVVLDATTLEVISLTTVGPVIEGNGGGVFDLALGPDGDSVFLATAGGLLRYSVATGEVLRRVPLPAIGRITLSRDGSRLFLADQGRSRLEPGSGKIFVFDQMLQPLPPIDLSAAHVNGIPPILQWVVESEAGLLFVATGTASRGPTYGIQSARVLVVEPGSGRVQRTIALNGYLPQIFVYRQAKPGSENNPTVW